LGLKLPVVALQNDEYLQVGDAVTAALDIDLDAAGMTVYNKNKFALDGVGIYVWDGNRWSSVYAQGKADGTVIPAFVCNGKNIPSVVFAPYNLGADTATINAIATENNISKTKAYIKCSVDNWDAVLGDYYQWGRIADGHEKRSNTTVKAIDGATYNANGQVTDAEHKGYFITNNSGSCDWQTTKNDKLWGNGKAIGNSTDPAGVPYGIHYYQSTEWEIPANNPCPAGFRVPTQDEWERIVEYDCYPYTAGGDKSMNTGSYYYGMTQTGLTWVRVKDGQASKTSWNPTNKTGWAIYKTADWNAADANYKDGREPLYAPGAPEPLLFLPAAAFRSYSSGGFEYSGFNGFYWSSSVNSSNGLRLSFSENSVSLVSTYRAYGSSVRCVAEE
jgi:hypothetical protein